MSFHQNVCYFIRCSLGHSPFLTKITQDWLVNNGIFSPMSFTPMMQRILFKDWKHYSTQNHLFLSKCASKQHSWEVLQNSVSQQLSQSSNDHHISNHFHLMLVVHQSHETRVVCLLFKVFFSHFKSIISTIPDLVCLSSECMDRMFSKMSCAFINE